MSTSRLVITVDTNLPLGTLNNIGMDSSSRPKEEAQKLINFLEGCKAGARAAVVNCGASDSEGVDALSASQTATFSGAAAPADTVTINGVVLTAVASSPTNNQWIAGVSASADAAALASAINSSTSDDLSGVVSATSSSGVVTVKCNIPGVIGNVITIAKSSSAITLGGSLLSGGLGRLPALTSFRFSK